MKKITKVHRLLDKYRFSTPYGMPRLRSIRVLCSVLTALTCNCAPADNNRQGEVNFRYSSREDGSICAPMGGKTYCAKEDLLRAAAAETDSSPGFLIMMPVTDQQLASCNEEYWRLDDSKRPAIQVSFSDQVVKDHGVIVDTDEKYYERMLLMKKADYRTEIEANSSRNIYGLDCLAHSPSHASEEEMMCMGGEYGARDFPFFFTCDRDGDVPYPTCTYTAFTNNLHIKTSFSKKCASHHKLIISRVLNFITSLQIKGKD
ncbi:hypothetical protein [Novosphingobium sp. BL-52-GroH]|uniref:hypothetical protein n=1 Tax=Novosphingobium sp. BL-52-GroH TaxID=3349877 RepID=UPI00384E4099